MTALLILIAIVLLLWARGKFQPYRFRSLRLLSFVVFVVPLACLPFALVYAVLSQTADGYVVLINLLGWTALVAVLRNALKLSNRNSPKVFWIGVLCLALLAGWSWLSAASMKLHAGVRHETTQVCILATTASHDYVPVTSIWEMRIPSIMSTWQVRSYIMSYHALLVVHDNPVKVYNWSKKWMRFEPLDLKRNPYVPTSCDADS